MNIRQLFSVLLESDDPLSFGEIPQDTIITNLQSSTGPGFKYHYNERYAENIERDSVFIKTVDNSNNMVVKQHLNKNVVQFENTIKRHMDNLLKNEDVAKRSLKTFYNHIYSHGKPVVNFGDNLGTPIKTLEPFFKLKEWLKDIIQTIILRLTSKDLEPLKLIKRKELMNDENRDKFINQLMCSITNDYLIHTRVPALKEYFQILIDAENIKKREFGYKTGA